MRCNPIALVFACLFCLAGCETTAPYASCPLDKEVTDKGICTGTSGSTSCVVTKHPQCEQAICLSYFGTPPVCTQPCTTAKDCPNPSEDICWTFAPADVSNTTAQQYCVPPSAVAAAAQQ